MTTSTSIIPEALWAQQVPLHITHPDHPNTPFVTSLPRFSYLPLLLPRLNAFFGRGRHSSSPAVHLSSFHYRDDESSTGPSTAGSDDVLLRNLPLGLLVDLYRPSLPWRLTVRDGPGWDVADTFLNAAKEADFARYGSARRIMSLSQPDTAALWHAVRDNDRRAFARVNALLLDAPTPLRAVPLRLYIPSAPGPSSPHRSAPETHPNPPSSSPPPLSAEPGTFKQQRRLGSVLRSLLPALFPSSRDPVLANVLLHGVPAPFSAPIEDLMREAAYPDGWLCLTVVVL
ncbi:autophagy protein [Sodiomyces alkalinus F11]|uniref:Autophagy protein 5 n=1 Tax=Sodiomyces alkalinus (strain CBS 110278 / VKM F-3762 / F11) TaxID=1314773 RepID=A0A3N2Q3J6_SODAK|nr:autophagy protein [Sodiomyces alkalinus F11]ROT41341.1 autophagy protein [Sodiomyces alkalinus F11]